MFFILFRKERRHTRRNTLPIDSDRFIVPHDAAFACRIVKIGTLVRKNRVVAQHVKSVREAFRNIKLILLLSVEHESVIVSESRRVVSQIDCNIVHAARYNAHEFSLRMFRLKMQTAQNALCRTRLIVLHEARIDPCIGKVARAVRFEKIAARISEHFRHYFKKPRDRLSAGTTLIKRKRHRVLQN